MTESRKPPGRGADPPDDRSLVRAAQGGDAQAFRALVEKYQRRVYQLALGMVKDADEAMDITQETFVRVHRYLPSFKGDSSFFTWTYRIATNLCLDAARKRGLRNRVAMDEQDAEIEARMDPPSAALAGPQRAARRWGCSCSRRPAWRRSRSARRCSAPPPGTT